MDEGFEYFEAAEREPEAPGRFVTIEGDLRPLTLGPGLMSRPLVGSKLLASFVRYEPGAGAPRHAHEEEQLFVMLEGEVEMELESEIRRLHPGDAVLIPAWVPHSVRSTGGPVYQLDVFSPPRRALLKLLEAADSIRE
jgi:quercetin dioxygenase-like cupin family protein